MLIREVNVNVGLELDLSSIVPRPISFLFIALITHYLLLHELYLSLTSLQHNINDTLGLGLIPIPSFSLRVSIPAPSTDIETLVWWTETSGGLDIPHLSRPIAKHSRRPISQLVFKHPNHNNFQHGKILKWVAVQISFYCYFITPLSTIATNSDTHNTAQVTLFLWSSCAAHSTHQSWKHCR